MKKRILFQAIFAMFAFAIFLQPASALTVSMNNFTANDSGSPSFINLTFDNTFNPSDSNFTQINISLPSGFSMGSYSGSAGLWESEFIDGNNISLGNLSESSIVSNGTVGYYWFNMTNTLKAGTFNLTVVSVNSAGGISTLFFPLYIIDTIHPSISFDDSVTPSNNSVMDRNYIPVKVAASDNVALFNITISLISSSGSVVRGQAYSPFSYNFTNLSNGNYEIIATANDTSGNLNSTELRHISLNFTNTSNTVTCAENWTCVVWGTCNSSTLTKTCTSLVDANHCGTTINQTLDLTEPCTLNCTKTCSDWAPNPCTGNETQTMTCTYSNGCKSPEDYNRTCPSAAASSVSSNKSSPGNEAGVTKNSSSSMAFIIILAVIIGSIIAVVIIFIKLKNKAYSPSTDSDFGNSNDPGRPKAY